MHDLICVLSSLFTREENLRVTTHVESNVNLQQSLEFPDALAKRVSIVHAVGKADEIVGAIEQQSGAHVGGEGLQDVRPR